MKPMKNEQRIMNKGGSLPGCMAESDAYTSRKSLDFRPVQQAQLATRPLAPASLVAALPAGSFATPSAGDSPRLHGRAVRIANDQAATPSAWLNAEVVV